MEKVKIDKNAFVYPMPMTIVGAVVDGKPNFLAAAWVTRVNFKPPMIMVGMIIIGIIGASLAAILRRFERVVCPWRRDLT